MTALTASKFHISVNVSHLGRALAFYRVLFGLEPAKCHADYAKFELTDPPVVFSLVPQPALTGGGLSRIGLRLADGAAVAAVRARLEAAGLATQTPGADCCANPEDKCYVTDPDLNCWQVYAGEEARPPESAAPAPPVAAPPPTTEPVVWEHFVTQPLPERVPHADGSVDEVRLTGTFNSSLDAKQRQALLGEARRVLRPGGKVVVHGLVGDRPFPGAQPKLPGLAAMVARVPVQTEPVAEISAAGFIGAQFVKFTEKAWFDIDGVELREVKLTAWQPTGGDASGQVVYRGPFREAVDDAGQVYPRGARRAVAGATAENLRQTAPAHFHFCEPPQPGAICSR